LRTNQQYTILPLDVEILIENVTEEMLRKGTRLEEANKNFEVALMVMVIKKITGDEREAAKLLGMNVRDLFCRLSAEEIGDNWWRWDV